MSDRKVPRFAHVVFKPLLIKKENHPGHMRYGTATVASIDAWSFQGRALQGVCRRVLSFPPPYPATGWLRPESSVWPDQPQAREYPYFDLPEEYCVRMSDMRGPCTLQLVYYLAMPGLCSLDLNHTGPVSCAA